ncbi:MAG: TetR family transcriptional regulator [Actinomycetota bacterium]
MAANAGRRATRGTNARGRNTYAHLQRVALELFLRDGYEATTVDVIVAEAGVSRRTFFHHFQTKLDVLWGDSFDELSRFSQLLWARREPDIRDALLAAIVEHGEGGQYDEVDLLRFQVVRASDLAASYAATWQVEMRRTLGAWLADRSGRTDDDPGVRAAAAALEALRGFVVEEWAASGGQANVGELASAALDVVDIDLT